MRPAISLVLSSLALCSGYLLRAAPPLRRQSLASHAVRMQTAEEPPNPLMELSIELTSFSGPAFKPEPLEEEKLATGQVVVCTVLKKLEPFPGSRKSRGYEVDIGGAKPAFVPRNHVALQPNMTLGAAGVNLGQGWAELPAGVVMEGQVLSVDENMNVNVSFARVQRDLAWQRVTQLANFDVSVDATILKLGDQGTTLDIEGLPAFMPWSHWSVSDEERDWRLQGTKLRVKFLQVRIPPIHSITPTITHSPHGPAYRVRRSRDESAAYSDASICAQVDRAQRRLVVSRRRELLDSMREELEPGAIVEGTVKTIKSFGAVVSLGSGLEGLLHVSQISQEFVQDVSKVLAEGDAVRCVLLSVDSEDASVKLSTKMLETKPGEMLQDAAAVYQRAGAAAAGKPADGDQATE